MASSQLPCIEASESALAIIQKVVTELKRPSAAPTAIPSDTQEAPSETSFVTAESRSSSPTATELREDTSAKEVPTLFTPSDQHENVVSTPKVSSAPQSPAKLEDKKLHSKQLSTISDIVKSSIRARVVTSSSTDPPAHHKGPLKKIDPPAQLAKSVRQPPTTSALAAEAKTENQDPKTRQKPLFASTAQARLGETRSLFLGASTSLVGPQSTVKTSTLPSSSTLMTKKSESQSDSLPARKPPAYTAPVLSQNQDKTPGVTSNFVASAYKCSDFKVIVTESPSSPRPHTTEASTQASLQQPPEEKADPTRPKRPTTTSTPPVQLNAPRPHFTTGMAHLVELQVGERRFTTAKKTLTAESQYFKDLLAGKKGPAAADGSWFIDADPDIFRHLLEYMRTKIYPLFWDEMKGFDRALYMRLAYAAIEYGIGSLTDWINKSRYQELVTVKTTCRMTQEDVPSLTESLNVRGHIEERGASVQFIPSAGFRKVYLCPRRIHVHKGRPDQCGRACLAEQGDDDDEFEDQPVVRTFIVKKEATINMGTARV